MIYYAALRKLIFVSLQSVPDRVKAVHQLHVCWLMEDFGWQHFLQGETFFGYIHSSLLCKKSSYHIVHACSWYFNTKLFSRACIFFRENCV